VTDAKHDASRSPWPFDPRVRDLLETFLRAAQETGRPYAIGGALAMAAHGYARQTNDVDAFLADGDIAAWSRALRAEGLRVEPVVGGIHYVASSPEHGDVRIDLLVPADDPEWSAVQAPETGDIAGVRAEVFPVSLLVAAKFQSTREEDHADVKAMYERGLFDPRAVVNVFRAMKDGELADEFARLYGR
jgi:hypothetical protein